jgi:hypothetical protein
MTTLREKRHRQCLDTITRLTGQREEMFRRLTIVHTRLADERRRLGRLQKLLATFPDKPAVERPRGHAVLADLGATLGPAIREAAQDAGIIPAIMEEIADDPIPAFLDRRKTVEDTIRQVGKDAQRRAEIMAENAARKTAKARGRIAKMKAKQSGETRRSDGSSR